MGGGGVGSTANLVALGAARQWAFEQVGIDPSADGLDGRPSRSIHRPRLTTRFIVRLGCWAMGRESVRAIPTDAQLRMDLRELRDALQRDRKAGVLPVAVRCGCRYDEHRCDRSIRGAGELAREFGAWFHVDGAYGLPGILDERVAPLYDGLELADSAIADPHKWLGAPVGIAATFVRDRAILHRAFTQEPADYLEGAFADDDVQVSLDSMGDPLRARLPMTMFKCRWTQWVSRTSTSSCRLPLAGSWSGQYFVSSVSGGNAPADRG